MGRQFQLFCILYTWVDKLNCSVYYIYIYICLFCIMYTYTMPSPIHVHVYVCSIVYISEYCVCPYGRYDLLDFEIKLYLS